MKIPNPYAGLRGLPPAVWIIFATQLINRAGMMALPFLVLYVTRELHVAAAVAGLAVTVYGIGGILIAQPAGKLCDRLGAFTVIRGSLFVTGAVLMVVPLMHSFAALLVATFVWGVLNEAGRPANMAALSGAVPASQRQAAIAVNRLAINIGMSIGPALGGLLATVSFPLVFIVDSVSTLAAATALTVLLRRHRIAIRTDSVYATSAAPSFKSIWHNPAAVAMVVAAFMVNFVFMQDIGALPLYVVRDLHHPESFFGSMFLLNTALIILIEVPLNLQMHRVAPWIACVIGALLIASGYGALVFARGAVFLYATVALWTFGEMIFFPTIMSAMANLADARTMGEYMGALGLSFSMGLVFGPLAGSALLAGAGARNTWLFMFAVGAAGAGVLAMRIGQRERIVSVATPTSA